MLHARYRPLRYHALRPLLAAIVLVCLLSTPQHAEALIEGGTDNGAKTAPGWPVGAADVFNAQARVAYWVGPPFGGGQWHGEFRGDTEAFNRTLEDFAQLNAKVKRLVVHDGVGHSFWLNPNREEPKEPDARIDWTFVVWELERWKRLQELPADLRPRGGDEKDQAPPPQIDVYTGGNIRWDDVNVPEGIQVIDQRLTAHGFSPKDGTVLEGNVVDLATQAPIAARMRLERVDPQPQGGYQYTTVATAQADNTGRWVLRSAPAGWHRVVVEAQGYAPRVVGYETFDEQPHWSAFNTGLSPAATVSGNVTDADGRPLADVQVRLQHVVAEPGDRYDAPKDYTFKTGSDGRFLAREVPIGRATIQVRKPGYCRPGRGLEIETPAEDVSLVMGRAATILVTVDFSETKRPSGYIVHVEPAEGAAVGSWGGSASLGPDNTARFENVPPGTYVLSGRPNPGNERQQTEPIPLELKAGEVWSATLKAK